ncbi:MAG: hypothetical protein H6511_04145 [Holophagales bacterium]|nr:hypothetical protein [Holophagales bacterium]
MNRVGAAATGWIVSALAALAIAIVVGWFPTRRLAGEAGLAGIAAGCAVAFAGAALGAMPVLLALAQGGAAKSHVVAARAMGLRAGGTLAGTLAIALGTGIARTPFLIWTGVAYGALLVVETRWTVRWLAASDRQSEG